MTKRRFTRPDGTVYSVTLEHHPGGLVYMRQAKERHKCWRPQGWAFDKPGLMWAIEQGVQWLVVETEQATYSCPASALGEAIPVNFGCGEQLLVPERYWTVVKKERPRAGGWEQLRFSFGKVT